MGETVGIVGGTGWLGLALGRNLLRRGLPADALSVTNRRGPTNDYAGHAICWATGLADLVARSGIVVLSVRPEDYAVPAPQDHDGLVVSFMVGVPLHRLARDWPRARIARAMPGGGATQGTAHVPWCGDLTVEDAARVTWLLSAIGIVDRVVDEGALAYLSALSGSGAAYPALMAQAMLADAIARGIAPDVAWNAVRSVICDSPDLFRDDPAQIDALLAAYHGYRGVTAAGLSAAEAAGFPDAIRSALAAATDKAIHF
jgi:pyrroline-5-carboxylate reductase